MNHDKRRGDEGTTDQLFGRRLWKDHPRIEAVGVLDELNATLGLARACLSKRRQRERDIIASIHVDIFIISAEVATPANQRRRLKQRLDEAHVEHLETIRREFEARLKPRAAGFVAPGRAPVEAMLHMARTQARRAERRLVSLKRKRLISNPLLISYLNRLSDLLFFMTQAEAQKPARKRTKRSS